MNAIELRDVIRRFGHLTALRGVTLSIPEGKTFALFGPNGAGKSTLLRIIATLGKPTSGTVHIRGIDVRESPEQVRAHIGLISHQTLLYDDLTAHENLVFYAKMYGLKNIGDCVDEALETVGLSDRRKDRVRGFSRGMKQRLAIARATLHQPEILLLDEPFTGLDSAARSLLADMIVSLRAKGRTILLVTHDLGQGLALADRFGILRRGDLVHESATEALTETELRTHYEGLIGYAQA
ncbi:MAG: heme ABC exporter ATP-binding protein CcmA [bacterium]|nr:heme ABC exporter ATP-binding protein CcmA [bacterium]